MFTIDLLHGQGVPIRSKPEGLAILAGAVAVVVVVSVVMFGFYVNTSVAMSIQKREIINYDNKIAGLTEAVKLHKSSEQNNDNLSNALSEVRSSLSRHTQWSPILAELVKSMPEIMVLTELEAKQKYVKIKVPKKDSPHETTDVMVVVRTLRMNLSGNPNNDCDKAVRDFMDRLRVSELLGPKLENIKVSQKADTLNGQNVVAYEIDCILKPVK